MDLLAQKILARREGKGIREAATEVGVSSATLSRIENGKIPDLETFSKVCKWLGEDPALLLGLSSQPVDESLKVKVHFKKSATISQDTATALAAMIVSASKLMMDEQFDG